MPKEDKFFPKHREAQTRDIETGKIGFFEKLSKMAETDTKLKAIVFVNNPKTYAENCKKKGIKVVFIHNLIKAVTVEATPKMLLDLSDEGVVTKVWEDLKVKMYLNESVPIISAPQVWKTGPEGQGIIVAIVDTGVDGEHQDLKGKLVDSKDFSEEGYFDGSGHGTHVASTICGTGAASKGKYKGVAPQAKVIAAKVLDSSGSGSFSAVIAGIEWATEKKPHAMNLSLGGDVEGSCDGTDPVCLAVDAAWDKGIVVCVAAGNAGPASSTVGTPGCSKKIITIGASDKTDQIAWFSSRGPTKDDRVKPDILLPGSNIVAARAKDTSLGNVLNEYYTSASGTSMATPHCAGVVALMLSATAGLSPDAVKQKLMGTAIDLHYEGNTQGAGRVDAYKAITGSPTPPEPGPPAPVLPIPWHFQLFLGIIAAIIILIVVLGIIF